MDWIRAVDWMPYQSESFVTPPFAGHVSGHSTFSRAGAEVLAAFTGDPFFPGGLGEFVAPQAGLVALYRNDLAGTDIHWLEVHLDTGGNPALAPEGFGSVVRATTGSVTQHVYVSPGATYLGQSEAVAHFGLGAATTVDQLEIEWADVAADQILSLAAPAGPGAPGSATFDPGSLDRLFFVIVGNNGSVEGSFGVDGSGVERPEDVSATGVCDLPRDLTGNCS